MQDITEGRRMLRDYVPSWKLNAAMFLDNNIGGSQPFLRNLCLAIERLDLRWAAAITFNAVSNTENLQMMSRSGCRMLFTGLESFNPDAIEDMNKRQNAISEIRRVLDNCYQHGIVLISGLLLSAEMDTVEYILSIPERLRESGLRVPSFFGFEAPIPGTPLFHRMASRPQPAFLPNALLCDFNGYTLVLRPRKASLEAFTAAYKRALSQIYTVPARFSQIAANVPGLLLRGQLGAALVESLLHWSAVRRGPSSERTYITGCDVPMPDLTDVPLTDSDFGTDEERRAILEPWKVTDEAGNVLPEWKRSDRIYRSKGSIPKELLALV
jgi:hypothetical protein